jgi:cobalamin biosynthesis Mg chelatase CobN
LCNTHLLLGCPGEWDDSNELGDTWVKRNSFAYGRVGRDGSTAEQGAARPEVLEKLLQTTDRIVQEIDSVEYARAHMRRAVRTRSTI